MGLFPSVEERAAEQALEIARALRLPVSARSRPTAEVRGKGCALGGIVIALGIVGAAVVAALLAALDQRGDARGAIGMVLVLGFAWLVISGLRAGWRSRRTDYVDPELTVEAGPDGVVLSRPGASHRLPYAAVEARILSFALRQGVRFLGVRMESPFGTIQLDDALFVDGRRTAAAIVARLRRAQWEE